MIVLAIDPGYEESAWLTYDTKRQWPIAFDIVDNPQLVSLCRGLARSQEIEHLVIEMIASYGMPVGKEVFETCVWIGRFIEAGGPYAKVYRKDVKMHLCGSTRAKDSNVRQALIDRFGPGKEKAIGLKKTPGPLYGVKKDVWSALAVAVTWADLCEKEKDDE